MRLTRPARPSSVHSPDTQRILSEARQDALTDVLTSLSHSIEAAERANVSELMYVGSPTTIAQNIGRLSVQRDIYRFVQDLYATAIQEYAALQRIH